jgi:hypothetical protein
VVERTNVVWVHLVALRLEWPQLHSYSSSDNLDVGKSWLPMHEEPWFVTVVASNDGGSVCASSLPRSTVKGS